MLYKKPQLCHTDMFQNMLHFLVITLTLIYSNALCSISQQELWNCALGSKCLNKYQLHAISSRHKTSSLQQPFILAIEGPKYKRLYDECDANKDGCLDLQDIKQSGDKCMRSCLWRETMKSMLCHS